MIEELAKEFKKHCACFGEDTEKYITFTVPIEKEVTRIVKNGEEITKNISYILQFIDSARFMASSLSNLVNNFPEGIHRVKGKFGQDDKKCGVKTCGIKHKCCDCFLEYTKSKDDLIEYICFRCNKNCQKKLEKKLKERFVIHTTIISLFYYCKKVFILMNTWMIEKISMKHRYLKKKTFTVT